MRQPAGELWTFTIRVSPGNTPGAIRVRRLLKYALRSLGLRCVRLAEPEEMTRLRKLVDSLAARVAAQSELLTARAERENAS